MSTTAPAPPAPTVRWKWFKDRRKNFERRHDLQAEPRQRMVADVALGTNLFVAAAYVVADLLWRWHTGVPEHDWVPTVGFWVISLLALVLASSCVPGAIRERVARRRLAIFYGGCFLNLLAVAAWIELTGGAKISPFTAVLLAMVLAGQQFGRFRANSWILLGFTVLILGLLLEFDHVHRPIWTPKHEAPTMLAFVFLVVAFGFAAATAHAAKPPNPCDDPEECRIEITGGGGTWRYRRAGGDWHQDWSSDGTTAEVVNRLSAIGLPAPPPTDAP